MERTSKRPAQGLTVIELLILVSITALIIVFALPMMSSAIWKTELDQAVEITEESVEQARTAARFYKSDVLMRLEAGHTDQPPHITLSVPRKQKDILMDDIKADVALPEGIRFVNGDMVVQFNADGEVDLPVMIMMASHHDEEEIHSLMIE
jgi:Tfp pilus assembly protein FimT